MERFSLHAGTLPDQPHGFTAHKQALKTLTGMCLRVVFCTAPSPGACQSWGCWVCHCPLQQGTGTQPGPGTVLRIALSLSRQDSRNGGLCKSYRDWSWNSGRCLGVQVVTQSLAGQVPDECRVTSGQDRAPLLLSHTPAQRWDPSRAQGHVVFLLQTHNFCYLLYLTLFRLPQHLLCSTPTAMGELLSPDPHSLLKAGSPHTRTDFVPCRYSQIHPQLLTQHLHFL